MSGGAEPAAPFDPAAPLRPSGNLRRRAVLSRCAELLATGAAALAVAVLAIVLLTVVARGAGALSLDFLLKGQPDGIGPAIAGTALMVALATAIATPVGVLIAVLLTEFPGRRRNGAVQLVLDLMNGLPSIIIGLFVFGLLVAGHSQSALAASVALSIVMLPLIARGSQEVLLLVPPDQREAAEALGVSRWRAVLTVVLPAALAGIVTATVLAVARAAGETAPLIFASSVFDSGRYQLDVTEAVPNIPVTIYQLSEEANPESFARAWGASLVLVAFILFASLGARALIARRRDGSAR